MQDDGQELLQACISEQWDVAEALIKSGGMLEAQDKVIDVNTHQIEQVPVYIYNHHASNISLLASWFVHWNLAYETKTEYW